MNEPGAEQVLSWRRIAAGAAVLIAIAAAYLWLWQSGTLEMLRDEPALMEAIRLRVLDLGSMAEPGPQGSLRPHRPLIS